MVQFNLPQNSKILKGQYFKDKTGSSNLKIVHVYRWSPEKNENPREDTFEINLDACGNKVLDILNKIKMYLILKGSKLAGDKDLVTTLENNKNIEIITQSSVKSISGNSTLQQITLVDSSGAEKVLDIDALFIELGSKINLDYVKHLVKINTKGEIEIESGGMTSHPAIFAAGDATTIPYKQIIVACGDGSNAGLSAFNYIEKLKGKPGLRADWKKQIGGQVFHY